MTQISGTLKSLNGQVHFVTDESKPLSIQSADIYRLVFDTHEKFQLSEPAVETCPGIKFESAVRDIGVRVFKSVNEKILASGTISIAGAPYDVPLLTDHYVIENVWYPFEKLSYTTVKDYLAGSPRVGESYELDIEAYSILYQQSDSPFRIYDDINENEWSIILDKKTQPTTLQSDLYPYQLTGYRWLSTLVNNGLGCILADEMGLGKTLQVIALIAEIHQRGPAGSLLVVPLTLIENWRRELIKFAPTLKFYVHHGDERMLIQDSIPVSKVDFVITTYDIMVRDIDILKSIKWKLVVLDEAQAVKNIHTNRASAARKLSARSKIAMTGTPLENSPDDLWSLGDLVNPGFFGPMDRFKETVDHSPDWIRRKLRSILLRRDVREVLPDLPELISMDLPLLMSPEENKCYTQILDSFRDAGPGSSLGSLTTLRRATAHPGLIEPQYFDEPFKHSAKLCRLFADINEIQSSGEKALVSCEWVDLGTKITCLAKSELGLQSWTINGSTPAKERLEIVDRYSSCQSSALLTINPKAAGFGLNIQAASHVFHYTLPWNPAVEDQVTKRALRIGQQRPVVRHRPYYVDTIDEVMWDLMISKRQLFNDLVPENDKIPPIDVLNKILRAAPIQKSQDLPN